VNGEHDRPSGRGPRQPQLRIEVLLSHLLRGGVVLSTLIILAGIVMTILRHPDYSSSRHGLSGLARRDVQFPHSLGDVAEGLGHGRGMAVVAAGLLVLILTPVMRVAASVVAFAVRRDWTYTVFTLIVLILLLVSFALGKGG